MKYLITESQLNKVIFKYLDNQDFIQVNYTYETYFVNSRSDRQGVIRYDSQDDRCYIDFNLIDEVSSFFSLKETYSKNIIKMLSMPSNMRNLNINLFLILRSWLTHMMKVNLELVYLTLKGN